MQLVSDILLLTLWKRCVLLPAGCFKAENYKLQLLLTDIVRILKTTFEAKWWAQSCFHWTQRCFLFCTISPPYTALKHDENLGNAEPWPCCERCPLSCGARNTFGPHLKCVSTRQNCWSCARFSLLCFNLNTCKKVCFLAVQWRKCFGFL